MKLISCVIRPERLAAAKEALFRAGVTGIEHTPLLCLAQQRTIHVDEGVAAPARLMMNGACHRLLP